MQTSRQCRAKNKSGARCGGFAVEESGYCFAHDPAKAKARAAARRRGGQAKHIAKVSGSAVRIAGANDILELVNKTILDSWELENSASRSRVLLQAASTSVEVLQIGQLSERVAALEAAIRGGVIK